MRPKFFLLLGGLACALGACERQPAPTPTTAPAQSSIAVTGQDERLPFAEVRNAALAAAPGDVLEVELDERDDRSIYEFTILSPNGRVIEVEVDVVTGAIVKLEQD